MGNNELDNVNEKQEIEGNSTEGIWIATTIGMAITAGALLINNIVTKKALKQEREKNKLYQDALKKHQAEISELKSEKERRAYKDRLWEELQAGMEE